MMKKATRMPVDHAMDCHAQWEAGPPFEEGAHGVGGDAERLVAGKWLQPAGHGVDRHDSLADEHEDEDGRTAMTWQFRGSW